MAVEDVPGTSTCSGGSVSAGVFTGLPSRIGPHQYSMETPRKAALFRHLVGRDARIMNKRIRSRPGR